MFKSIIGAAAALSLVAIPVAASAAPANPAASLSLGKSVRAGAPASRANKFAGGAVYVALVLAGVIAIVAIGSSKSSAPASP